MNMSNTDRSIKLSVREARMIVERILLTTGLPAGLVPAVGNAILYSQAAGLSGLAGFQQAIDTLKAARHDAVQLVDRDRLDGGGQHAWLLADDLLDLALAQYRMHGAGAVTVSHVAEAAELRVVTALAERHRAQASVELNGSDGAVIRITADRLPGPDAVMDAALRDGLAVPHALWRTLYDRSADALTPDSIESRRHAGPVMVDAEGRVHGRDDDDTDFELLLGQPGGAAKTDETKTDERANAD